MASDKVLINLSTGLEDPERVTVAFLVATAALDSGRRVGIWMTKEAVRLALPGYADAVGCDGCPPLSRLFEQFLAGGGELMPCPICVDARKLDPESFVEGTKVTGATPMWEWVGEGATVFSY
jgi:predicted peroxiredoxin